MSKQIEFDVKAREAIKRGVDALANTVKVTLGPQGRNVLLDTNFGVPIITKDGVTVAKNINKMEDPLESMGARLLQTVASRTNDIAGDGTTTATVLAQAIVEDGLRNIAAGANPMRIKKGIDLATEAIIENLKKRAKQIEDVEELISIATISANNDETMGKFIGEAYKAVGNDGVISVEKSKNSKTYVDIVEGLQVEQGYLSPYFVTNTDRMECVLEDAKILIYNGEIHNIKDVIPILEKVVTNNSPLLIIATDVKIDALQSMVANKVEAGVKICAIKPPGYGERRISAMEDIASITGGKVISAAGSGVRKATEDWLGTAESIRINATDTTIIGGAGTKEMIDFRVEELKAQTKYAENSYEENDLKERIANLKGGIGVIYVGANSEVELQERRDRIEDAKNATKAALEEGVVEGGGIALLRSRNISLPEGLPEDVYLGAKIVNKAVQKPFEQILENAGEPYMVILEKVMSSKRESYGYDANVNKYVNNMLKSGIIDPLKVTRVALENAASVAGMILTTQAVVADTEEPDPTKSLPMF